MFQSDGGREFDNTSLGAHFSEQVSIFKNHVLKLNLRMVWLNASIVTSMKLLGLFLLRRTCLLHSGLMLFKPLFLSLIGFLRLIFMDNLLLRNNFKNLLIYNFFKTFGCFCYPNFSAIAANKLAPRSTHCVFLTYAPHCK